MTVNISVEESQYLASRLFASGLLVGHDTVRGGKEQMAELTAGEKIYDPLLDLVKGDIEARGDDTALVQTSRQFDDDLIGSVIVDDFEFTNVTCCVRGGQLVFGWKAVR